MTLLEIIAHFKVLTGDTADNPYLWPTDLVKSYADLAEAEACTRKPLLVSSTLANLCVIPIVANTAKYTRVTGARQVFSAKLSTSDIDLIPTDVTELNYIEPNWKTLTGDPKYIIIEDLSYEVVPTPVVATTLTLRVSHTPVTLASTSGTFSIDPAHHYMLLFYMLFLAFSKKDADTEDPNRALNNEILFSAYFGPRPDAYAARTVRQVRDTNRLNGWI